MNSEELNDIVGQKLIPEDALLFYKNTRGKCAYVEHRPISDGVMGAGKPLTVNALKKIMDLVGRYADGVNQSHISGCIPENLLYASSGASGYYLVWYRQPEERMMYFVEGLAIPNGVMKVPGLVYKTDGHGLSVYAYKGSKPKRILYSAPFFNTSSYVCLGNGKIKKPKSLTYESVMKYWEDMFWLTEFAHILGSNPVKGNLATISKECIEKGVPFPTSELKRVKIGLKDLFKDEALRR